MYLWIAPGGVDSRLKIGLPQSSFTATTQAMLGMMQAGLQDPFCRTPAELLLFRQQIAVMLPNCCPPLYPEEGPGGCRCPLRLPHTHNSPLPLPLIVVSPSCIWGLQFFSIIYILPICDPFDPQLSCTIHHPATKGIFSRMISITQADTHLSLHVT